MSCLDINQSISCVKADPYLINRPSFQCETHRRNEKWYVNGCCDVSFCSSNLTLDTSKMFDDKGQKGLLCHLFVSLPSLFLSLSLWCGVVSPSYF